LRPIFEEVTRRLVSAEHLRLVDAPAGFASIGAATGARAITVPVPAEGTGMMVLEAVSAPGRTFAPWELQVLHGAGLVAGLLLEIERARQVVRGSAPTPPTAAAPARGDIPARWPDGAAPLIGSSPAIRVLRHKIERVAATDFTVLIEGGIERVGRDLTIRVEVQTTTGQPLEITGVEAVSTPPDSGGDEGPVDPVVFMKDWARRHGADAAQAWNELATALERAAVPGLALGQYAGGGPYVYLRQTSMGRVYLLRLSERTVKVRDVLHKNSDAYARDAAAMAARQEFRAALLREIPGSEIAGSAGRVYLPLQTAADHAAALIEALSQFARAVGARPQ
jgi:hypothetical protein